MCSSDLGFIRRSDLSRERSEQRPDRFSLGDRVDARITNIDRKDRRVSLSIKAHEFAEEKQAMAEYGSSDSGASLGDILGAAISRANQEREAEDVGEQDAPPVEDAPDDEPEPEAAAAEETSDEPEAEATPAEEASDEPVAEAADPTDDAAPESDGESDGAPDEASETADAPTDAEEEVKPEA